MVIYENDEIDNDVNPPTNQILRITYVDQCFEENGREHHTDKYWIMRNIDAPDLVVRRGQSFKLILVTNREYCEVMDGISFIFTVSDEEKPTLGHGNLVAVPLLNKINEKEHYEWSVLLQSYTHETMTVLITPAVDCIVAQWKMEIDCRLKDGGAITYNHGEGIFILFNPWCKYDQVYLKSEEWRDECVLNDTGLLWRGSYNRRSPNAWRFAQFEQYILECSILVVHKVGKLNGMARGDPTRTARVLSAAVNSQDDQGVVRGKWDGDFGGGTAPLNWVGSMEILQKFYKNNKPVEYGQCWVFSGVLCTICRALGIPCRSVTNFRSAHDQNGSLTVDYYVDENGKSMEELTSDFIWNFHVWNEVWMKRPDIGTEYDGWQVIDATPHFPIDNLYQNGPSSVVGVKNGEILKPYESPFLFGQVNADKVYWRYAGPTQPLKLISKDIDAVGQFISTKAAGKWERLDITSSYKYAEHTQKERDTMAKALRKSPHLFSRYYLNEDFNDIYFNFELRDDIIIGQPFDVTFVMKNRSKQMDYTVGAILRVDCVLYTGRVKNAVKKDYVRKTIKAGGTEVVKLHVTYDEYVKRLLDQCAFQIACLATVEDTEFEYFAQDDFRVRKPDIKIKLVGTPVQNKEILVEVSLENPLPVALRKGKFMVQGPGLEKQLELKVGYTVETGLKANVGFKFIPPKDGRNTIVAKFISKELDDVDGFLNFMVEPSKEETNGINNII